MKIHREWINMFSSIPKSKLKKEMYAIFRQLQASGQELVITDHGKPVLKIIPIRYKMTVAELFGDLQGRVTYLEDINRPTIVEWEEA